MRKKEKNKICNAMNNVIVALRKPSYYEYKKTSDEFINIFTEDKRYYAEIDNSDYETCLPFFHAIVERKYSINGISMSSTQSISELCVSGYYEKVRIYFRSIEDIYIMLDSLCQMLMIFSVMYKKFSYDEMYKKTEVEVI